MKITSDFKNNVKDCLVSVDIKKSSLNHIMCNPQNMWIMKLIEFFTLIDLEVMGYTAPLVFTELHLHLNNCQVDYSPIYLPLRAALTVDSFSITSNIVVDSPISVLRFVADNAALHISNKCEVKDIDLINNYIRVIDVGMFELIMRTSTDKQYPKLDLRASNDLIRISTCVDTCRALTSLISYLAADGDLSKDTPYQPEEPDTIFTPVPKSVSAESLSKVDIDRVNFMMNEAMHESTDNNTDSSSNDTPTQESELFFYANEMASSHVSLPGSKNYSKSTPERVSEKTIDILYDISDIEGSNETDEMTDSRSNLAEDSIDDDYCIIEYDQNIDRTSTHIKKLCKDEIIIIENYLSVPKTQTDQLLAPAHYPNPITIYTVDEMSLVWQIYGGYDFKEVEVNSDDIYTEIKFSNGIVDISKNKTKTFKSCRDNKTLVELHVNKLRFQYDLYGEPCSGAPYYAQRSRQAFLISDLEVHDLLATSSINKLLYQYTTTDLPKQSHSNMICVKAVQQQVDQSRNIQECSVKVSLQPIRLNIDQDSLFFLKSFFTSLVDSSVNEFEKSDVLLSSPPGSAPSHIEPVMQVGLENPVNEDLDIKELNQAKQDCIAHGIYVKFDELSEQESLDGEEDEDSQSHDTISEGHTSEDVDAPIYFKNFIFSPDVPIRLDYHGKRVDMKEGTLVGLLVGLGQLNCSQLKLKRLHIRHGILGVDRLVHYISKEWLEDIVKNQLPSILGGLGPMHSIIQLVKGVCDLVSMPIEQYKRDGRILRGLRRGANSFVTCTAMSALDLTNRLVQCVHFIAELTYNMLSPGPSCQSLKRRRRRRQGKNSSTVAQRAYRKRRQDRVPIYPAGIYDGFSNACHLVSEGVKDTASSFVQVAKDEHEIKGYTGAVGGVLRQIPSAIVHPVILVTEATSCVLGGMKSQLLPSSRKDDQAKWKQVNYQENSVIDNLPI